MRRVERPLLSRFALGVLMVGASACGEATPAQVPSEPARSEPSEPASTDRDPAASPPPRTDEPSEPAPSPDEPPAPNAPPGPDEAEATDPAAGPRATTAQGPQPALLGEGPPREDAFEAIAAPLDEPDAMITDSIEHGRRTFAVVRVPERPARGDDPARSSYYLVRVRSARAGGETVHRREAGVLLYEYAVPDEEAGCDDRPVETEPGLRARDLDGDGEVEVTVILAAAALHTRGTTYDPSRQCGAVAFLVGADDLEVQARFTREYHHERNDAGGESYYEHTTTWRVGDQDGDGHADLHVNEAYRSTFDFMGDYIGGGESAPAEHARGSNRRSFDCPYDVASDRWVCPPQSPAAATLFRGRQELEVAQRAPAPPAW